MTDHITVVGNIATEPEQRRTTAGVAVTSFRLASTQRHFDARTNAWVEGLTNWYRVSTFRALAENAFTSLRKGQRVIVTGKLKLKEWEAGGKKGIEIEIDADALGADLLWGTTTFTRAARADARDLSSQPAPGDRTAPDEAGETPVTPSAETDEWATAPLGVTPF